MGARQPRQSFELSQWVYRPLSSAITVDARAKAPSAGQFRRPFARRGIAGQIGSGRPDLGEEVLVVKLTEDKPRVRGRRAGVAQQSVGNRRVLPVDIGDVDPSLEVHGVSVLCMPAGKMRSATEKSNGITSVLLVN